MAEPADEQLAHFQQLVTDLIKRAQLARDFATTPGNGWLARAELNRIKNLLGEMESTLSRL